MVAHLRQVIAGAAMVATVSTQVAVAPEAYSADRYRSHRPGSLIKGTAIGGALGAGIGALGGAIAGKRRAGRGALWGLGTGAGIGAVNSARQLRGRPFIRNTATGALAGLGIGGTMRRPGKGAGIGALVGAGLGAVQAVNGYE
jgi:hypothetical protein